MKQPLIHKRDNDYVLAEGESCVWIEVGRIAIYIRRLGGEVVVAAYDDDALKEAFAVVTGE